MKASQTFAPHDFVERADAMVLVQEVMWELNAHRTLLANGLAKPKVEMFKDFLLKLRNNEP